MVATIAKEMQLTHQYIVNEQGQKTAVVLSMSVYQQIMEDLHDLAVIAARRDDTPINLSTLLLRLGIEDELQLDL